MHKKQWKFSIAMFVIASMASWALTGCSSMGDVSNLSDIADSFSLDKLMTKKKKKNQATVADTSGKSVVSPAPQQSTDQVEESKPSSVEKPSQLKAQALPTDPPDRIGGSVTIKAIQKQGRVAWVLPEPGALNAVMAEDKSLIFPIQGTPPFFDWKIEGAGQLDMTISDLTAMDGVNTKDRISFVAEFGSPDKRHHYRVVVNKPLPHGDHFLTFGGVVTDHLMFGNTGIGTAAMPMTYVYAAFWGVGDVYVDGYLINPGQVMQVVMANASTAQMGVKIIAHLIVSPYKLTPKGMITAAPLHSAYIPFVDIEQQMTANEAKAMKLSPDEQDTVKKRLAENRQKMNKAKRRMQNLLDMGRIFGQPYMHIIFNDVKMQTSP